MKGPRHGRGKRWLARWVEPDGRERSRACSSKDEARAVLARVETDQRAGTYVSPAQVTFEEYARTWLARQAHQRASTREQAESRLRLHAYPVIGATPLPRITRGMVQDLVAGSGLAPSTTRVLYGYIAAVLASAVDDRLIATTPCRRIRLPEVHADPVAPLTVDEVAQVAAAVPRWLSAMVWVGAGSGLRPGLRSLTVDRVEDGVLVVDRQARHPGVTPRRTGVGPVEASGVAPAGVTRAVDCGRAGRASRGVRAER